MKLWQVYRLDVVTSPSSSDPLDWNVATDSWVSVQFKCPFFMLLILSVVSHTFLELKTSNRQCTVKNGSTYPCSKFLKHALQAVQSRILFSICLFSLHVLVSGIIHFIYFVVYMRYTVLQHLDPTVWEYLILLCQLVDQVSCNC